MSLSLLRNTKELASRYPHPIYEICQYAKGHRTPIAGTTNKSDHAIEGHLKDGNLHPGHRVSADHFESRVGSEIRGKSYHKNLRHLT